VIAPQHFAVLGVEGEQRVAVAVAHEHQVAGSGEHTTGPAWTTFGFPDHFTTHGIPGLQPAVVGFLVVRLQRGAVDTTTEGDQRRRTFGRHLLRRHRGVVFPGGDVDQAGQRTEGIRVPGVATGCTGPDV